jgi:hypothetical protein
VLIGNTDVEDTLQRLKNLTEEEAGIASAELLRTSRSFGERIQVVGRVVQGIVNEVQCVQDKVESVDGGVQDILGTIQDVNAELQSVGHGVQDIDHNVQGVSYRVNCANRQHFSTLLSLFLYLIYCILTGNFLRDSLRNWLSPPNPSTNHNILCNAHLKGTTNWFTRGAVFNDWKSAGSLLWTHGNREFL